MANTRKPDPIFKIIKNVAPACDVKGYSRFVILDTSYLSQADIDEINALNSSFLENLEKAHQHIKACREESYITCINGHEIIFHVNPESISQDTFDHLEKMNVFCDYDAKILSSYYF